MTPPYSEPNSIRSNPLSESILLIRRPFVNWTLEEGGNVRTIIMLVMNASVSDLNKSVVLAVDLQPRFLSAIHQAERVVRRSGVLLGIARILGVPVIATVQYSEKMGGFAPELADLLETEPIDKLRFSCSGCAQVDAGLAQIGRRQVVLVGIETHICVTQTALDLLGKGFEVFVCADAVGARTEDRHQIGIGRLRDAGVAILHSESAAYEWMRSADHPQFRNVLPLIKSSA